MSDSARILAFTPTHDNLLRPETVEAVEAMQFNGELTWIVSDENPYPGRDMRNVCHQYNIGRRMALDGDYDALLTIEHDMIVPEDAAQKLWDTDAPVVYGTYMLRHGMHVVNLFQKCSERNLGMSLSMHPRELVAARKAGQWEVSGSGMGCLLIKRHVLEAVPFKDLGNAPDLPFAADCLKSRYKQMGRTDVTCGHIDEDGRILDPWKWGGIIGRVEALQTVTIRLQDGSSLEMKKGRYYSIPVEDAREHGRAGYVRITNEADAVADEIGVEVAATEARETATAPETKRKRKKGVMSTKAK